MPEKQPLHDAEDGYNSDSEAQSYSQGHSTRTTPTSPSFFQRTRSYITRKPLLAFTAGALILLIPTFLRVHQSQQQPQGYTTASITNRTLGFQKIYAIGLPEKYHKHDTLLLAALQTEIDIEYMPGVPWKDIPENEWPDQDIEGVKKHGAGLVGAWRAHMTVMEDMITNNIQTALILEDDADWDVFIKPQMVAFAHGLVELQKALGTSDTTYKSPYGDSWDMLWTGPCQVEHSKEDSLYYLYDNDTTAPAIKHQVWDHQTLPEEVYGKNKRAIFRTAYMMCVAGFAVTQDAARKVLAREALYPFTSAEDVEYGRMCGGLDDTLEAIGASSKLECYGVWPGIHGSHRRAGKNSLDSDVWAQWPGEHPENTVNIVYPAAMNIARYQWGDESVQAQWDDCDVQFVNRSVVPEGISRGRLIDLGEKSG